MENQCNFQTVRPAFYSGILLRFEYQSPRKKIENKRGPQLISYLETIAQLKRRKQNVREIHNMHWFRTEIHRLKGTDRRDDKEILSFTI